MRASSSPRAPIVLSSAVLAALSLAAGCLDSNLDGNLDGTEEIASELSISEGFESGSKTAYAAADVTLGTGVWNLDEALIGTSTADRKNGLKAARVRYSGKITMRFDRTTGAGTVSVRHATYGSDASSSWALFYSLNQGGTWTQVGSSRTTTSSLGTASFTVNRAGVIRFEIRKLTGSSNRINIDDIAITDYGSDGDGGGGGGSGAALSVHTTLGIPSASSTSDLDSYLSVKDGYVISYNSSRKVPNWVSWRLNTSYLGSVDRQDDFRSDSTLPSTVPQATLADYSGSGYDRGHMCPSADRTLTTTANSETFYLTNMVPQAANNNRGPWAALENEARSLAGTGKELFIIAGGTFSSTSKSIGNGVKVPDKTFKVIVVLDAVGQGPSHVTTGTRVIGVLMPNADSQISPGTPWRNFRVSVDAIEALTGHDYLSDVDPAIQAVIEARVDNL
jgi:endonuclease G, mitochondrial